jgi:hypothetical protein
MAVEAWPTCYTITQVDDKFVWRAIHTNGVLETGIGWFPKAIEEDMSTAVEAQWNFHGGRLDVGVHRCAGTVILVGEKVTEIRWEDRDRFQCVP